MALCTFCIAKQPLIGPILKTVYSLHNPLLYRLFAIAALLLASPYAFGQYPSDEGRFEVDYIKGCADLKVKVTNTSGVDPNQTTIVYKFDYKPGEPLTLDTTQSNVNPDTTYKVPGIYKIFQIIGGGTGSTSEAKFDSITIEVLEPRLPTFKVYNCVNNGIYIDLSQETYYDKLRIDYGDGSPADTFMVANVPDITHDYSEQNTYEVTVEGIFDNASTNCAQSSVQITTLDQEQLEVGSIDTVRVLDAQRIQVDYRLPDPNISYQLERAIAGDDNFTTAYSLDNNTNSFIVEDLSIDTRTEYFCFRVAAVNRCDPSFTRYSDTLCSIALQATAGNLVNNLSWQTNTEDFTSFDVLRDSTLQATVNTSSYTDTDVQCLQDYLYQVTAQQGAMVSLSEAISLTAVRQDTLAAIDSIGIQTRGIAVELIWQAATDAQRYYLYREGNSLPLQQYDSVENNPDGQNAYTYQDANVEPGAIYCYQIAYLDACGNLSRLSTQYCIEIPRQAQVVFPTAFTPNGDGLNDVFVYKANLLSQIELQIFNRWGEMVFHTNIPDEGWDGTYQGKLSPEAVYIYHATITDELGNQFQRHGSVTLLNPK